MSMPRISPQVVLTALALPLFSLACVEDPTEGGDDIAADTGDANTTDGTDATDGAEMGTDGGTTTDGTDTTDTTSTDTTDTTDTTTGETDCPIADFPPVSPDPANGAYPDPFVEAHCEGDEVIVDANGIPGYEFVAVTPNPLQAQNWHWHFPLHPQVAGNTSTIPLLGSIGVAVNGMPLFGPNEAQFPDPFGDPVYNGIVDFCKGHTAMMGIYHYHALLVSCLVANAPAGQPSPVVGFAFDGFPIYGPMGCADADCTQVVEYQSGWVQTGDPSTYAWDNHEYQGGNDPTILDQCNGHVGPGGDYHYHATASFPYILG
ncbi:MAG: YHYH protein, partial [Myxococcales bacterium]|nr:YHYH protein [Myxococcales bacterium]